MFSKFAFRIETLWIRITDVFSKKNWRVCCTSVTVIFLSPGSVDVNGAFFLMFLRYFVTLLEKFSCEGIKKLIYKFRFWHLFLSRFKIRFFFFRLSSFSEHSKLLLLSTWVMGCECWNCVLTGSNSFRISKINLYHSIKKRQVDAKFFKRRPRHQCSLILKGEVRAGKIKFFGQKISKYV